MLPLLALKIPDLLVFIFRTAEMLYVCQVFSATSRFHLVYLVPLLVHVAAKCSFGIRGLGGQNLVACGSILAIPILVSNFCIILAGSISFLMRRKGNFSSVPFLASVICSFLHPSAVYTDLCITGLVGHEGPTFIQKIVLCDLSRNVLGAGDMAP